MFIDLLKYYNIITKDPDFFENQMGVTAAMISNSSSTRFFGTFPLIPPEQEKFGIVTDQSDIYMLGLLLFELVSPLKFTKHLKIEFTSANRITNLIENENVSQLHFRNYFQINKIKPKREI